MQICFSPICVVAGLNDKYVASAMFAGALLSLSLPQTRFVLITVLPSPRCALCFCGLLLSVHGCRYPLFAPLESLPPPPRCMSLLLLLLLLLLLQAWAGLVRQAWEGLHLRAWAGHLPRGWEGRVPLVSTKEAPRRQAWGARAGR